MSSGSAKLAALAAASSAAACLLGTSAFVPALQAPPSPEEEARLALRGSVPGAQQATAEPGDAQGSAPWVGLALAAGSLAAAGRLAARGKAAPRVARGFFGTGGGGGAPASSSFNATSQLGAQAPLGFWDPLGLSKNADEATFRRRRAVEIKHGRVAMYATIGYIVPQYYKFPGYLSPSMGIKFSDVPNGLAAFSKLPWQGGAQIVFFAGFIETTGFFTGYAQPIGFMKDSTQGKEPGNYGVGFPNFLGKVQDPEVRKRKLASELANGRLAMVAIIGMFFQDGLTGSAWGDWALFSASPLRAEAKEAPPPPPFEPSKQLGAMAPLGFFDPAGFSKTGDQEGFRNLRAAELKHGRVAMMAALGGVSQHFVKFPGFESVPSGLQAVSTAPGSYGFVALFLLSGAMELAVWTQDPNKEVGDFGDPVGLGMYDQDMRNREINNGRFAMFAAIGIIAAELVTGKDAVGQFGL